MSYIFPAGTKRTDWISEMAKTAKRSSAVKKAQLEDTEQIEKTEEIDVMPETEVDQNFQDFQKDVALEGDGAFDAIKDLPGIKERADELLEEIKGQVEEIAEKVEEVAQTIKVEKEEGTEEKAKEVVEEVVEEVEEKAEEKEEKSEDSKEIKEVELEITDGDDKEVEVSFEPGEKEVTDVGPEEIKKEGDKGEDCSVEAQSNGFVKIAKLSPKNKTALKQYWLALGFPKEYVESMVKDY